ncbi:hypothetical protein HNY73_013731 [Argiope bruennichi]|uniref:Uncharacterized protein n=1 Tax=Argiope bruennichi TaxID=94029 RepID=A0A8T0EQY0_ARGBR|nr:hypothetical protein HNY73_013731 [Argiope bruennichi]
MDFSMPILRETGSSIDVICLKLVKPEMFTGPDWKKHVHAALRTVTHESTGFSPAELVHGKNIRTSLLLLYENWLQSEEKQTPVTEYVFILLNRLKLFQELSVKKMEKSQQKNKTWYVKKSMKREFQEGDMVLMLDEPVLSKPYRTSPRQNEILWRKIQKMLAMKIIEVGYSDYTSPMVLVEAPKKEL